MNSYILLRLVWIASLTLAMTENINEVKNIIKDKSYDINEIKKYLKKILNDFKNDKIKNKRGEK